MAGLMCMFTSGEVALVAATAKTVVQLKSPTNQRLLVTKLEFFGKQAAGGTDTPVKIRLTRSTANFGTATGSATVGKLNPSNGETLQAVVGYNFTVEPTTPTDAGYWWEINPQLGVIEDLPLGKWIEIPGGQALNIECTSIATPTVVVTGLYEE